MQHGQHALQKVTFHNAIDGLLPCEKAQNARQKAINHEAVIPRLPFLLTVFARRHAHSPFEHAVEMLRILVSQLVCNLVYGLVRTNKFLLRHRHNLVLYAFLRRLSRFFSHEITKIVWRQAYLVGKILDGGQSVQQGPVAMVIIVKQSFKPLHYALVDILAGSEVASAFHAGDHGSTFGGNPLACAAACVVLDALIDGNLMENAKEIGAYLQSKFEEYKAKYPNLIKEVRGRGLILGMELTRPGREIANECLDYGAIINCTAGNVLRFVPPLNITKAHVDELILQN